MQYSIYLPGLHLLILRSVLFAKRGTNYSHTIIKCSIIPTDVYFDFYGTGYINERKLYVVIDSVVRFNHNTGLT